MIPYSFYRLAKRLPKTETEHVRFFILQAPRGDALAGTTPAEYRTHLETLLAWAKEKQMKPILVTIPVQENNPNGELSRKLAPYNDILREVPPDYHCGYHIYMRKP